jgi:hypothetical protein
MTRELPAIIERERRRAPAQTPQALSWHDGSLWIGSRDLRRVYRMDAKAWTVTEEMAAPGIPWAAVSAGDSLRFTIGEDPDDDRYIRRYVTGRGFSENDRMPCPDFTGSYLSYDGENLYLSQWYKHRILQFDSDGKIGREIAIGAEISGHVFVDGAIYVLRGTEQGDEDWRIARFNPREAAPEVEDLARVPFQCRSLTFDGQHFWANHRVAGDTVSFDLPR